jgi:hypothetical protein
MGNFTGVFFRNRKKEDAGPLLGIEPTADGKGYRLAKSDSLQMIVWDELTELQKEQLRKAGVQIP